MTERTHGETEGASQVPTEAGNQEPATRASEPGGPMTQRRRDVEDDDAVDPGVLPEDAPRGGTTVPMPNNTGMTTPPVGGWGEAPIRGDDDPGA
jgi:hypothetical protein